LLNFLFLLRLLLLEDKTLNEKTNEKTNEINRTRKRRPVTEDWKRWI
jgi:hypothetical protein